MPSFSQSQLSTIYGAATQYWVVMEVQRALQNDPAVLSKLYVTSATGKLIPLDTVASFVRKSQVMTVNHEGELPSVTVSYGLGPGVSLGTALTEIRSALKQIGLPATISGHPQGTAEAFQKSLEGNSILLLLAVFVIYIVLGILYAELHPSIDHSVWTARRGGRSAPDVADDYISPWTYSGSSAS